MGQKNEEIQSRRSFFKKTVMSALPIIAAVTLPSLLTACGKDDDGGSGSGGSSGGGKGSSCHSSCAVVCRASAQYAPYACKGTCKGACTSCKGFCAYTSR